MIQYINGKTLRDMIVSGANNLQNNKDLVDKLNVFPVPDGDTGTNMSLTISYAMKELAKVDNDEITNIGKALGSSYSNFLFLFPLPILSNSFSVKPK